MITAQRNWIGRSEGAHVDFAVDGRRTSRSTGLHDPAGHAVRRDVHGGRGRRARWPASWSPTTQRPAFEAYLEEVRKASEIERLSTDRPKTGVFLGVHAINPVNGERIPVCAADYVLADYGTGAIMAVPGQDQRDWDFAKVFDLPIVRTVAAAARTRDGEAYTGDGPGRSTRPTTRSPWTGWTIAEAKRRDHRLAGAAGHRHAARSTSGCATGCCRGSATGAPRSRSSTARRAARCRCPRTSCPSCCPSCAAPT